MTSRIKRTILRIFFAGEIILFSCIYLFGPQGVSFMMRLKMDNRILGEQIAALNNDIAGLEREIVAWNEHPFYKEKVAREKLQMARTEDIIFYLP